MQRGRLVVTVEERAQLRVQDVAACHRLDVLRHAQEIPLLALGIRIALGQIARELGAARKVVPALPVGAVGAAAEVRAGAKEGHDGAVAQAARDDAAMGLELLVHRGGFGEAPVPTD
jgi:myo-inositol catabolism protein IolC